MNTDILLSYLLYPGERLGGFVPTAGLLVPLGFGPSVGALVLTHMVVISNLGLKQSHLQVCQIGKSGSH